MPDLEDGERVTVQGSGANRYELAREGAIYSCSCPAWRNMRLPVSARRCKHLIAYLGDAPLLPVTPRVSPPEPARPVESFPVPVGAIPRARSTHTTRYDEPPERRNAREAALAEALDLHVVLTDKMEETYALRLPRDIAYAAGFYLALSSEEREAIASSVTGGLIGVGAWFVPGGLEATGDARLRDRAAEDPPELVPVMLGARAAERDQERFALLYDDPFDLPTGVVVRAGKHTRPSAGSLLEELREQLDRAHAASAADTLTPDAKRTATLYRVLAWLDEVARRYAVEPEERSAIAFQPRFWRGAFPAPYVPGWSVPSDLSGPREYGERHAAYAARSAVVSGWIDQARDELADGRPGRALFLGRELHIARDAAGAPFRAEATELLVRAYAMLGRVAFGDLLAAHHRVHDPDVPLYELPPAHGIILAASADDREGLAEAWRASPPTESDVEAALERASSVAVFDAIFERIDDDARDRAIRVALGRRLSDLLALPIGSREREALVVLVGRFVERAVLDARTFERILTSRDEGLIGAAGSSVDLASISQGATPLHVAVRAANVEIVRVLLERGADARAKNAKGRMAFDEAEAASGAHPREAHAIMLLLEARGGARGKVPTMSALSDGDAPPAWKVGDEVRHPKFGAGVVVRIAATAPDAKLEIRFGKKDVRVLLAKFVSRS